MKQRTFRYLLGEGVRGMRRHPNLTLTAVITTTASLLVLGVFLLTSYNVRRVINDLEGRKEVVVYLSVGLAEEDRGLLEKRLHMHPAVAGTRFVSKDQAWEEFSSSMNVDGLLETVGGNPLPDSYRLDLVPGSRDAATIDAIAAEVRQWDEVDEVLAGGEWVGRLDSFARSVLLITAAIGLAVALSIVAIVANTVRLTVVARQDLIHIMKCVGASEGFIRLPFLSEGVLQAGSAALIALGVLYGGTILVSGRIDGVEFLSPVWCAGFLGLAIFLGFTGSAMSVRHVIRKTGL
jgi:cell division transport system permease protein